MLTLGIKLRMQLWKTCALSLELIRQVFEIFFGVVYLRNRGLHMSGLLKTDFWLLNIKSHNLLFFEREAALTLSMFLSVTGKNILIPENENTFSGIKVTIPSLLFYCTLHQNQFKFV